MLNIRIRNKLIKILDSFTSIKIFRLIERIILIFRWDIKRIRSNKIIKWKFKKIELRIKWFLK